MVAIILMLPKFASSNSLVITGWQSTTEKSYTHDETKVAGYAKPFTGAPDVSLAPAGGNNKWNLIAGRNA